MYCNQFRATLSVSTCLARQKEAARPWGYRQENTSIGACYKCAQGSLAAAGEEMDDDMEILKNETARSAIGPTSCCCICAAPAR